MQGQDEIIRMRLRRQVPGIVFVNDYPCSTDWFKHHDHATVCTHGLVIQLQDFRFLTGLRVSISSESEIRAKAIFEHIKAAGANTVAACHIKPDVQPWKQDGWVEVWHKNEVAHG